MRKNPSVCQPHAVARTSLQRLVQCCDVLLNDLDEFCVGLVLENEHALHRQIGRVDLQYQSGINTRYKLRISITSIPRG